MTNRDEASGANHIILKTGTSTLGLTKLNFPQERALQGQPNCIFHWDKPSEANHHLLYWDESSGTNQTTIRWDEPNGANHMMYWDKPNGANH